MLDSITQVVEQSPILNQSNKTLIPKLGAASNEDGSYTLFESESLFINIKTTYPKDQERRAVKILQHAADLYQHLLDTHSALMAGAGEDDEFVKSITRSNQELFKSIEGVINE